ncbi:MAG: response regulator transcription factor, partial [Micrococcales bacterium]|nr:response regulator transcription factor [Micrococcales bacterium]
AARSAGLEIVTMTAPGMQKGLNRREHHAELVPQIQDAVAQAAAENIPFVIVFSGNRDGQDGREGLANCRLALEGLADFAGRRREGRGANPQAVASLTPRETDVLREMARGLSNSEIAESLYLSEQTVKTHVAHILTKLAVRDRTQAVVFAYENGVV